MELTRIDTIVQFTKGSTVTWSNVNEPVPLGAVVIDTVNRIVKEGDGTTLFSNLPVCLDYNFNGGTSGASPVVNNDIGGVVVAANSEYDVASTKLADVLSSIADREAGAITQATAITAAAGASVVETIPEGTLDGMIVVVANGKYAAGTRTIAQLVSDIILSGQSVSTSMNIDDLVWYSDSELTVEVATPNMISENNTYWCKISGWHDAAELKNVDFALATTNPNVTIITDKSYVTSGLIACVYGGVNDDEFKSVAIDHDGNIICAGWTHSEGTNIPADGHALIVKFDTNLNILIRKVCSETSLVNLYYAVTVDSNNNIICAGMSGNLTFNQSTIVKFDTNLSILVKKVYGSPASSIVAFFGVAIDSNDNIIVVGYNYSEGLGSPSLANAFVVKFDTNLSILARKIYGGAGVEIFYGVATDSNNNIICTGVTNLEGTGWSGMVIKFDSSLNILARKIYGGAADDGFNAVAIDSGNNIICVGQTYSEGLGVLATYSNGLVVKFDSNLNILDRKVYSGAGAEIFHGVAVDSNNNIICVGSSNQGIGFSAIVIKFNPNLSILSHKYVDGTGNEFFYKVAIDVNNNIICIGSTTTVGAGSGDGLVIKFPSIIPSGTLTGSILTGIPIKDSTLELADSTLTLANSALTLSDSALTLANSTLTLAVSTLTQTKDIIIAGRELEPTKLITAIYSSSEADQFNASTADSAGNIIAVGSTAVASKNQALIVKFDATFNTIARKLYTGGTVGTFYSVIADASNNIICVGEIDPSNSGITETVIAKFNPELTNIIAHRTYGSAGTDTFKDVVLDTAGNFVCVGSTTSEGSGSSDALIVKFDANLTILAKKRYGGTGAERLISLALDTVGNFICVGSTSSEGSTISGLLLKLDANLNVILRKYYTSTVSAATYFTSVAVTSTNLIICAGYVVNTVSAKSLGLVAKFDSNLNIIANKTYGSTKGNTEFSGVRTMTTNEIVCVGRTNAEGAGDYDAVIIKLDISFNLLRCKTYGSVNADSNIDCVIVSNNDIVISGYGSPVSDADAMVTKFPDTLPEGVYTNKIFTSLILADSKLLWADDSATVNNSTLTMADSALTLVNSSLVLADTTGAVQKDVTIMDGVSNVFKVQLGEIATGASIVPITFNVQTDDGKEVKSKTISVDVSSVGILVSVYGGAASDEQFYSVATDSNNNIICVGSTGSEGVGSHDALIVKFDASFNILIKKLYGGLNADPFTAVAIDSNNNIICVGATSSEGVGYSCLVVKFDTNLNILARKIYGGSGVDYFYGVVVDSDDNIICAGHTTSEGSTGDNALVVKFDTNLVILARKVYGGGSHEMFNGVAVDSNNNIICAGYTSSEGVGTPAYNCLVVKFDNSLNILARKVYGGAAGNDKFNAVTTDSNNNIICVGYVVEGAGTDDAIVVKFDPSLNILAKKIYGGTASDAFYGVTVDTKDNVIAVGATQSEGIGVPAYTNLLVVKFDTNLTILARKVCSGIAADKFNGVITDINDNIICVGYAELTPNLNQALVVKFPSKIPSGSFTGTVITGLTFTDSNLTLADSTLTLADSALTLANSTLTLANSTLTLADSTLTQTKDTIII